MRDATRYVLRFSIGLGLLMPALLLGYAVFEERYIPYNVAGGFLLSAIAQIFPLIFFAFDFPSGVRPITLCYGCSAAMILASMAEYALIGTVAWRVRDNYRGQVALWAVSSVAVFIWSCMLILFIPWILFIWLVQVPVALVAVAVFFLIVFRPPQLVG
jgi:hypothetical protein